MLLNNPRGFLLALLIGLLFWAGVFSLAFAEPMFGGAISDYADDGYQWRHDHDPAHKIVFVTDPALKYCPDGTKACAVWMLDVCAIYTRTDWADENWIIARHELRHCAGWSHQARPGGGIHRIERK